MPSSVVGAAVIVIVLVIAVGYLLVRARQGPAPPQAREQARGAEPPGDEDPVPREPSGMPMVEPPADQREQRADDLQERARHQPRSEQPEP
jgi:hypothetical protein